LQPCAALRIIQVRSHGKLCDYPTPLQKIITMMTMKAMEENLPDNDFLRMHKSYIANKSHILSIEGNQIHIGHTKIPVSRKNKTQVMEQMLGENQYI